MSDLRLQTHDRFHTGHRSPAARSASSPITPAAKSMPPVEMQQHIAAHVRVAGLPLPVAFHADERDTIHLLFADGDTAAVDRWASQLYLPPAQLTGWGRYATRSHPDDSWYGWAVRVACYVVPAEPQLKWVEYGDTIEVHAPSPDPANPAAGALLGAAKYRPGRRDYMVLLAHESPFFLDRYEDVMQALASGRVPAEGRLG